MTPCPDDRASVTRHEGQEHLFRQTPSIRGSERRSRCLNLLKLLLRGNGQATSGCRPLGLAVAAVCLVIAVLVVLIFLVVDWSGDFSQSSAVPQEDGIAVTAVVAMTPLVLTLPASPTALAVDVVQAEGTATSPPPGERISVDALVEVAGTGAAGLRFRARPGLNSETVKVVEEGARARVLEGPQEVDGIVWWKLQAEDGTIGWAAGGYLLMVERPTGE